MARKHCTITKGDGTEITGIKADLIMYSILVPVAVTFAAGVTTMGLLTAAAVSKLVTK